MNKEKTGARAPGVKALAFGRALALGCLLAVWALAGCTKPGPEPHEPPTDTGTPTPTWDAEQARAIDAVQRYLDVTSEIGQNLYTTDWNRIYEVADDPAAQDVVNSWVEWAETGLHLVGAPVITVESVVLGYFDSQAREYHVGVCFDRTNAHLFDSEGKQIEGKISGRFPLDYTVLVSLAGKDLVIGDKGMEGTC